MSPHVFRLAVLFACCSASPSLAASPDARTYNLVKDFPTKENPHGAWSLGSFNHIYTGKPNELRHLPTYGRLIFAKAETPCVGGGVEGWGTFSSGFLGFNAHASGVLKNSGTSTRYSVPVGSVAVFPENGPIVARWTAPENGTISIEATFIDLTNNAGVPEVWVLKNQVTSNPLHYQKAYNGEGSPAKPFDHVVWTSGKTSRFKGTIPIVQSDTIDFVVDPIYTRSVRHTEHPEGDCTDTIGLDATISYSIDTASAK